MTLSLADAIIQENESLVRAYLQQGVPLNQLDEYGFTPLIEAAIADHLTFAQWFIEAGATVTLPDVTGGTALHWAAENRNYALCELLLQKGANPNAYTLSGQPVLLMPLLRKQQELKKLLLDHGAQLAFTQDFINTKLLGHLFELVGTAHIIDPQNHFVEVDFEGFFLEISLAMIAEALLQFEKHYTSRKLGRYHSFIRKIVQMMSTAAELIRYQQYRIDIKKYENRIDELIRQDVLMIPVGYEGHAITFIKYHDFFVKCDRRESAMFYDALTFYRMGRPNAFTGALIKQLIYEKVSSEMIDQTLPMMLALEPWTEMKMSAQVSGNCSFANVEACIPVLLFFLLLEKKNEASLIPQYKTFALNIFQQWREWNKDRALQFCINRFHESDRVRKACHAEILAAILFQACRSGRASDEERIRSILSILSLPDYRIILQNYVTTYCYEDVGEEGQQFLQLLKKYDYSYSS